MLQKSSLARDFTIFSIVILFLVLLVSVSVGILVHQSYYSRQESKMAQKALILDQEVSEAFAVVTHYAQFLGNKIISHDYDQSYLKRIFSTEAYYDPNSEHMWTRFNWVNPDKKLLLIKDGEVKEVDFSRRSFLDKTPLYPNKLMFSPPAIGFLSNKWVIPAGVGIKDKNDHFLGTINIGFDIHYLSKNLELVFGRKDLVFMLFDEKMRFVLSSNNLGFSHANTLLPPDILIQQIRLNIANTEKEKGPLFHPVNFNQFRFTYFKHSDSYPFYWVIGENIKIANSDYWQITMPRIAELSFMGLFFLILLHYFRKHIIKPIIFLADSARSIAQGDKDPVIYYGRYDEVNLLADRLKEIQETKLELIDAKNKVELTNKNLEHKVKERTLELEKALTIKTEFLNNISHEVRTPIQGITSISEGLVRNWNKHSEEKKLDLAKAVAQNSKRLFSLVSNLLDLTIFNDNKMYLNFQEIDLTNLINDIIEECNALYLHNKNIKIIFENNTNNLKVLIDAEKILQVLRNLITNSIKFMNEGNIYITTSKTTITSFGNEVEPAVKISIKDEGVTIPEEELEKIFSPFVQGSSAYKSSGGAGLGLAISKQIITHHRGTIWAENNENKGISVIFIIPIKNSHHTQNHKLIPAEIKPKTGKILMIDDESACQMSMDILLTNTGYTLISTFGGISGLQYLKEHREQIDLVLLDLMMPDMYGINVLIEIKKNILLQNIPIVIQSGTNDYQEIEKAFSLGAVAYMRKPYQRDQVLNILSDLLG